MARVLSFPFRLLPTGTAATVEEGSEDYFVEAIASHILTRKGEREMVPGYGITDPVFGSPDLVDIAGSIRLYGPDVEIVDVSVTYPTDRSARVVVEFD